MAKSKKITRSSVRIKETLKIANMAIKSSPTKASATISKSARVDIATTDVRTTTSATIAITDKLNIGF